MRTSAQDEAAVRRLSGADQSMVWPDDRGWPQDIGVGIVLRGGDVIGSDGAVQMKLLRERVSERLHLLPRFRECIRRPPVGLGGPYWVDAVDFDPDDHVSLARLPAPGGEAELLSTWERMRCRPFDPRRPRWEVVAVEGLAGGRAAVLLRVHHALLDGAAGIAALGALLDEAGDLGPAAAPWTPRQPPSRGQLLRDTMRRRAEGIRRVGEQLQTPRHQLQRLQEAARELRRIAALTGVPRTSFNHPIGPRRRTAVVRTCLEPVRDAAHRYDATINDVLLAAVTGGLRTLLDSRGEQLASPPRAAVPVAGGDPSTGGNATVSSLVIPLPVDQADPVAALRLIRAETTLQKDHPLSYAEAGIISSPLLERVAARFAGHQRITNLLVSNVPGPSMPLHLLSGEIVELLPFVPLNGNMSLGVGALSYASDLVLVAVADADLLPDLPDFTAGVEQALTELTTWPA